MFFLNRLFIEPTTSSLDTVWFDCDYDDKTDASLEKVNSFMNSLIIQPTTSSLETTLVNHNYEGKTAAPLEKYIAF